MTTVRVGVAIWPYLNPKCFPKAETGCDPGVELDILHTAAKLANLSLELTVTNSSGCGGKDSSGNWTGLLRLLQHGQIDIIGNLCGVNKLTQMGDQEFDISYPVWQYQEQFVIQALAPPPLSFAPLAPLSRDAWIAYGVTILTYLCFVTLYFYIRDISGRPISVHLMDSSLLLTDSVTGFAKELPALIIWPLWLLLLLTLFQFYNTFILAAILHPFPVWRPFSSGNELAKALLSGEYKLLSYRNPPPIPDACLGKKCEADIRAAISEFGFYYIPNNTGFKILSAIAEQSPDSESKLVHVNGMPFISLYMSEYIENRDRLWVIDNGFENWSAYVWRKNFPHARKLNHFLKHVGEYKYNGLSRAAGGLFGSKPQTAEVIFEKRRRNESIGLGRLGSLGMMYSCGLLMALLVLLLECGYRRFSSGAF